MQITTGADETYGPIQPNFSFEINNGYTVLVGKNDSGKSALLQFIFKRLVGTHGIGPTNVCILLPERIFIDSNTEMGDSTLGQYNNHIYSQLDAAPLRYHSATHASQNAFKLLINNYKQREQLGIADKLLKRLGFSSIDLRRNEPIIDDINVGRHGSGLRTVLPLIAALTDPTIKYVLIDEPESSLEPTIQKYVRDMLYEASAQKIIIVTTHSHLFLNRKDFTQNQIIRRESGNVLVEKLQNESQLYDLTFSLLGNNLSDFFFPENFLIVEGSSDQVIVEKFLSLQKIDKSKVKVFSATGIEKIDISKEAILDTLRPLVMSSSPYKARIVVLVDLRNEQTKSKIQQIESELGDRFFELNVPNLEEYITDELYIKAGRNKKNDIAALSAAKNDHKELIRLKKEISNAIASVLILPDLKKLPMIKSAIAKAIL